MVFNNSTKVFFPNQTRGLKLTTPVLTDNGDLIKENKL